MQLEREITMAKNDMIAAYQDRMQHFEKKISVKENW